MSSHAFDHPGAGGLVDLVTGSFGAGHDAAARALAEQLHDRGVRTRTWDVVDLMPGHLGHVLRSGYLKQVQSFPGSWRWTLEQLERRPHWADRVARALSTAGPALLEIAEDGPTMMITTHPFGSQVLGELRRSRRLDVPVVTYLTDMSVHRLWIHEGVDRHLAIHDLPALEASALGARDVATVAPVVAAAFERPDRGPDEIASARRRFGLPADATLALVTGGSCGIGDLLTSARDLLETGLVTPVVLCGSSRRLLARARALPGVVALAWVEDMPGLLGAVDVVVQNSGGMTTTETRASRVPLLTYRCLAGHGETNAAALDAAGVAPWVRSRPELHAALVAALRQPTGVGLPDRPRAVDVLLGAPVATP